MINRVLIRIKTIQLLYSYLLVEKPFSLESQPSNPTKEKRFAYRLYLDVIYLLYKLANRVKSQGKVLPLMNTGFIARLSEDDKFLTLKKEYSNGDYPFLAVEAELSEKIEKSLIFRNLIKGKDTEIKDRFWQETFDLIIMPDSSFNDRIKEMPGYSLSGVERMKTMMDETFKQFYSTRGNLNDGLMSLEKSMHKARELYMRLLALPVELTTLRKDQLEINRSKFLATGTDKNPNLKFVDNRLPALLSENEMLSDYLSDNKISWKVEDPEMLDSILKKILESDLYREYMDSQESSLEQDVEFWREVYRKVIVEDPDFLEFMETKSVFWNDDLDITTTFVMKTLRKIEEKGDAQEAVLPMYKDEEDARFGAELFRDVVIGKEVYKKYINNALLEEKWTSERLAFMDVVISMTALAEILNFPKIPLEVSINEYVEIAKSYSSNKSGSFVHGLLATIIKQLQEEGSIKKLK